MCGYRLCIFVVCPIVRELHQVLVCKKYMIMMMMMIGYESNRSS